MSAVDEDHIRAITHEELTTALNGRMAEVAEKAADRAIEKLAAQFGTSLAKKLIWLLTVTAVAFALWGSSRGIFKELP